MNSYTIEVLRPHQHIFKITLSFTAVQKITTLQVPYWRPGRYEGGNFTKNIIGFYASANGESLWFEKTTSHNWKVETPMGSRVEVSYLCYAAELTAGNTYLDENFLLINPVNALVYVLEMENQPAEVVLKINSSWMVATAMIENSKTNGQGAHRSYKCSDLQELLDTPILAAPSIKTIKYKVDNIPFYIDIYGEGIDDFAQLESDFLHFTETQIAAFGEFPVNRYHFLLLLLPHKAYHGVEHETSTVIIIGPGAELKNRDLYKELIGVSSHELYHTWNVKNLRPAEFTPYDFTRPTFSKLGYIVEGVTTYMGDKMLWESGFFDNEGFLNEISTHVQRHMDNEGRLNLSLADSSVDTWVDGYGRGTPRRRVSIYVEGALVAFVCDVKIWKASGGKKSLTDVMRRLYEKFGGKKGFTETDYWDEIKLAAGFDWDRLKLELVDQPGHLQKYFREVLEEIGLSLSANASEKSWERDLGISVAELNGNWEIINILENSPAEEAGLWFGDKILKVNDEPAANFFASADAYNLKTVKFEVQSGINLKTIKVIPDGEVWMRKYKVIPQHEEKLFAQWKGSLSHGVKK